MPDAGFFGNLLGGFDRASAANRQLAREDEDKQSAREEKILGTLIQSDDPDISAAALSAMAEIAGGSKRPKGGFLQRIVGGGRASVHPALAPIMDLLHTPGQLDVDLGRATGGAASGTGSRPSRGVEGRGLPSAAPPVVPSSVNPASVPSTPMTQGGPPSISALGSPGAIPSRALPTGLAPAADSGQVSEPTQTAATPPLQNTPPQAATAARATAAPSIGGPPPILPMQGQSTPGFQRTIFLPPDEVARRNMQRHAEGIELDMSSKVNGALKMWDAQHPAASASERADAHDQILEHELGVAPKWTNVPGTVQGTLLPPDALDAANTAIPQDQRAADRYFIRQQYGNRFRYLPTTAPASAATAARVTNDRDAVSLELFGGKFGTLDQPQQAKVNATLDRRAVNLAQGKAQVSADVQTAERTDRTQDVTVMNPDGSFSRAKMNGQGDLLDLAGKTLPDDVVRVTTAASLPPKLDTQARSVLTGINVMRRVNARLKTAIEGAGLTHDNNPMAVRWDKFLYDLGVNPGDMAEEMPFSEYAQLAGTSEAYGLRGLIGGRPNQSLINIYGTHLAQPNNTPELMYNKLQELDKIMGDVEGSVLQASRTKVAPDVKGARGEGAAASTLPANYDGIRVQNGVNFHVKTDATGKVTYAKAVSEETEPNPLLSIPLAGRGRGGGGGQ